MIRKIAAAFILVLSLCVTRALYAQPVQSSVQKKGGIIIFSLSNDEVVQQVFIKNNLLAGDMLKGQNNWLAKYHNAGHEVTTNGDFALKMMWTAWSAPGKEINANVQVSFSKEDYRYQSYDLKNIPDGGKDLELYFTPVDQANTVQLRITYRLLPGKFYARRQVAVRDTVKESNWLDTFISREGNVSDDNIYRLDSILGENNKGYVPDGQDAYDENNRIVKKGAFGQPCAIDFTHGGVFFGVEYPAANTTVKKVSKKEFILSCKEIIGTVVKDQWVTSKWVVEGLAPDQYVKNWFYKYLADIRVAPVTPYALYNSWYDLRSPAFKDVTSEHIMNEKNIMNIIRLFKKNMIEPYGIHLDAFVLDDGWDVHHSDWQLRKTTFPHGIQNISDKLKKV
jgi:hypothetical protein